MRSIPILVQKCTDFWIFIPFGVFKGWNVIRSVLHWREIGEFYLERRNASCNNLQQPALYLRGPTSLSDPFISLLFSYRRLAEALQIDPTVDPFNIKASTCKYSDSLKEDARFD